MYKQSGIKGPLTFNSTRDFYPTFSTNRVKWTTSDGEKKHGDIAGGSIHDDCGVHFSDSVTTRGSWVLPSAEGAVRPTARSIHGPPSRVPEMEAKALAQQGVVVILLPLNKGICHFPWQERDCSILAWTQPEKPWSSVRHHGFISAPATPVLRSPPVRQVEHWWFGETELMLTEGWGQCRSCVNWWQGQEMKSNWVSSESRESGGLSERQVEPDATRGRLKFDKNPKLGQGFCPASQECTLLSRGMLLQSVFSSTIGS